MLKQQAKKGFTLIEMMIVVAVISLLMILILPNASSILESTKSTSCEVLQENIDTLTESNTFLDSADIDAQISELEASATEANCPPKSE